MDERVVRQSAVDVRFHGDSIDMVVCHVHGRGLRGWWSDRHYWNVSPASYRRLVRAIKNEQWAVKPVRAHDGWYAVPQHN
jgi:hypothetical protein